MSRTKGKEKEDDLEGGDIVTWQTPREAHATDFGTFALLAGELAQEMRRRGSLDQVTGIDEEEQDAMLDVIRNSLDCEAGVKAIGDGSLVEPNTGADVLGGALFYPKDYWSPKRAAEAEAYLRDIVYGGVDGFAYVRSLAEFVTSFESEVSTKLENAASILSFSFAICRTVSQITAPAPFSVFRWPRGLNARLSSPLRMADTS